MIIGNEERIDVSLEALVFGFRAAEQIRPEKRSNWPFICADWAETYDQDGAEVAEERLRVKVAFHRAWEEWRQATRELAAAGERYCGPSWEWVSADLDGNRIRLLDGGDPREDGVQHPTKHWHEIMEAAAGHQKGSPSTGTSSSSSTR